MVIMLHNCIRDIEADLLKEVCKDVKVETELIPIGNTELAGANTAEKAQLDVFAVGQWGPMQQTFLDVHCID